MGLDIYLYKIVDKSDEYHHLEGNALTNASNILTSPLVEKEEEYVDWKLTFEKRGLNLDEYEWVMSNSEGVHFTPRIKNQNSERKYVTFTENDEIVTFLEPIKGVYVEEIGYQRKGMNSWSSVLPNCIDDDGTMSVFKKSEIEALLPHVNEYNVENFKNMLNHFEEGKTFLWFWW